VARINKIFSRRKRISRTPGKRVSRSNRGSIKQFTKPKRKVQRAIILPKKVEKKPFDVVKRSTLKPETKFIRTTTEGQKKSKKMGLFKKIKRGFKKLIKPVVKTAGAFLSSGLIPIPGIGLLGGAFTKLAGSGRRIVKSGAGKLVKSAFQPQFVGGNPPFTADLGIRTTPADPQQRNLTFRSILSRQLPAFNVSGSGADIDKTEFLGIGDKKRAKEEKRKTMNLILTIVGVFIALIGLVIAIKK